MRSCRHPKTQSSSNEDSQIDLLTLSSAMMLTVVCLLLSQILREKSTSPPSSQILNQDLPPAVHILSVELTIPKAMESNEFDRVFLNPKKILIQSAEASFDILSEIKHTNDAAEWELVGKSAEDRYKLFATFEINKGNKQDFQFFVGLTSQDSIPQAIVELWESYAYKLEDTNENVAEFSNAKRIGDFSSGIPQITLRFDSNNEVQKFLVPRVEVVEYRKGSKPVVEARLTDRKYSEILGLSPVELDVTPAKTGSAVTFWYRIQIEEMKSLPDDVLGQKRDWSIKFVPSRLEVDLP